MIYDYYFSDIELPKKVNINYSTHPSLRKELTNTQALKPYSGLIHHSSGVRAEHVRKIYRACFIGKWLVCNISERTNNLERIIGMSSLNPQHGQEDRVRFAVCGKGLRRRSVLAVYRFFFGLQAKGSRWLKPEFVRPARRWEDDYQQALLSETAGVCYTYQMRGIGRYQELLTIGELARLDWSKFSYRFPSAVEVGDDGDSDGTDGEHGIILDREDEVGGLDDHVGDDEREEHEEHNEHDDGDNGDGGIFVAQGEANLLDAENG